MGSGRTALLAGGFILALSLGMPEAAAEQENAIQTFPADYFAPFHPADAYDMVRKLPGFALVEGDDEVRGFSGSRGNILIDGRVPSGKQDSLEQLLKRIPATSVLRIDVVRGGASGTAVGGFDLVADIIRSDQRSSSHALQVGFTVAPAIGPKPDVRADLSRQRPGRHLEASFELATEIDDDSGKGGISKVDKAGETSLSERDEREVQRKLSTDVEYKFPLSGGEAVTHMSVARERTVEKIRSRDAREELAAKEHERLWSVEAGGQIAVPVGHGTFNALLVQRLGWLQSQASEADEHFQETSRTLETIGRLEYRRDQGRLGLFGSLEAALNRLEARTALTIAGVPLPLPGSRAKIGEHRGEVAAGAIWKPIAGASVEPSLRVELSEIRSRGDRPGRDAFLFLKPRLRASWNHRQGSLMVTIEREVAQLDFEDFVATVDLDRDDVLAGAASLRPPASWSATLRLEQRFWENGSVSLSLRREWIADVIDRVVVVVDDALLDAVGNIGSGKRRILGAELTAPLERLGLAGMEVRASLTLLRSRVEDPVTGELRMISEDRPFEGELSLTHDLPGGRWSWGIDASLSHYEREFRIDEQRRERTGTALGAFIEFRPSARWRLRAEAENLTSRTLLDERLHYEPTRAAGPLDSVETRRIETAPIFSVNVRRALGALAQ